MNELQEKLQKLKEKKPKKWLFKNDFDLIDLKLVYLF